MMNLRKSIGAGGLALTLVMALELVAATGSAAAAERLGSYPIDPAKVSISGISSGAFMANQFHIAHSKLIMGAGIIAGGLYGCAVEGIVNDSPESLDSLATGPCMSWPGGLKGVESYAELAREFADRGWIDPLDGLKGDRVYLFTGRSDKVVNPETVHHAARLYQSLGIAPKDLKLVDVDALRDNGAGHSWVTVSFGVPCDANKSPYINACGYDQAHDMLQHIYGELKPASASLSGRFVEFSQDEFVPGRKTAENGLFKTGTLYVPEACAPGSPRHCALHVVLHGCKQSAEELGDEFYKHIGVNEWADSNDIVVLYPQARTISTKDFTEKKGTDLFQINPEGCWNWFGYGYDQRYMLKDGVQITAIDKMIHRVMDQK